MSIQTSEQAEIERLREENAALLKDAAALRTVMVAAAEEIALHWGAHCDAEGYGPANLMHRLESGIPSEYRYTAGDFERLRAEVAALRKDAERYAMLRSEGVIEFAVLVEDRSTGDYALPEVSGWREVSGVTLDAAIDAAIAAAMREQAMQALVDQAQELDMGYGERK